MKVIVAIDDSPYSGNVVDAVLHRKWPKDTLFKVLTVVEPLCCDDYADCEAASLISELNERRKKSSMRLCERIRHRIEYAFPDLNVHIDVREGLPRTQIVNAAVDWAADKILLGAHGKDVCPHNLLGSVSRSVALQSPCSIEIVRAKTSHTKDSSGLAAKSKVTS